MVAMRNQIYIHAIHSHIPFPFFYGFKDSVHTVSLPVTFSQEL